MESEEHNVQCESESTLTYLTVFEHVWLLTCQTWKMFIVFFFVSLGGVFSFLELFKFFQPQVNLGNIYTLSALIFISFIVSISRCIYSYRTAIPVGLEGESNHVHRIARDKKHFWEYALFYQLLNDRVSAIDQELNDILRGKVHVKVLRSLSDDEYVKWLQLRPENLLKIVEVAKRLLIIELGHTLSSSDDIEVDHKRLLRFSNLVSDLYRELYEYEIEGRQILVPDDFRLLHEIQSDWVASIRDGINQMITIVNGIASRDKNDRSPIKGTIIFEEPPRIEEFNSELQRVMQLKGLNF